MATKVNARWVKLIQKRKRKKQAINLCYNGCWALKAKTYFAVYPKKKKVLLTNKKSKKIYMNLSFHKISLSAWYSGKKINSKGPNTPSQRDDCDNYPMSYILHHQGLHANSKKKKEVFSCCTQLNSNLVQNNSICIF